MLNAFRIGHKHTDEVYPRLWAMRFETYERAYNWILDNYPQEVYPDMEWVIVEDDTNGLS
jgi:hypothetical protein